MEKIILRTNAIPVYGFLSVIKLNKRQHHQCRDHTRQRPGHSTQHTLLPVFEIHIQQTYTQ